MPWFKKLNNKMLRVVSGHREGSSGTALLTFGVDADGKEIAIGREVDFERDSLFTNGSGSNYGNGSIVFLTAGGIRIVDADNLWQTPTVTTVSQSVSPSHSGSPSASGSPSVSPSASTSPSHSASPST